MVRLLDRLDVAVLLLCLGGLYLSGLGGHGMLMWDEAHYAVLGRALASGEGYVEPDGRPERLRPPVLPMAIAGVLRVVPDANDRTVRRVTVAAALLCVLSVYLIVKHEAGSAAAMVAAIALGSAPEFWRLTSYLLTEIPFMLFNTLAVYFFYRGLHVDPRGFLLAWPCFALALLTRYTALLFGPICLLVVLAALLGRDRSAVERLRSKYFVLGPLLAAPLLLPLFFRFYQSFGDPLVGFRAAADQLPDYARHATFPSLYYLTLLPSMLGWVPLLLLAAAVSQIVWVRDRLGTACLIAAAFIIAFLSRYGWKEPRLISAALPFFAIAIGIGAGAWSRTLAKLGSTARPSIARQVALAVVFVAFFSGLRFDPSYARAQLAIAHSKTLGYPSFLWAMREIDRSAAPSAVMMGPNCYQIAWYAKRSCIGLPATDDGLANATAADLVIATSFERGQPAYLAAALEAVEARFGREVRVFADDRYWTKIAPAAAFREPATAASPERF